MISTHIWKYRFHNKNQHNHYFLFQINHLHKITNTIRRLFLPSVIHVITINFLTHVNNYEKRMMLNAHNCVAKRKKSHERSCCLFTKKEIFEISKMTASTDVFLMESIEYNFKIRLHFRGTRKCVKRHATCSLFNGWCSNGGESFSFYATWCLQQKRFYNIFRCAKLDNNKDDPPQNLK